MLQSLHHGQYLFDVEPSPAICPTANDDTRGISISGCLARSPTSFCKRGGGGGGEGGGGGRGGTSGIGNDDVVEIGADDDYITDITTVIP